MPRQYTPRVILACERCSETFSVRGYRAETARFCSEACKFPPQAEVTCSTCRTSFRCHAKRASRARYCSPQCRAIGISTHGDTRSPEFRAWKNIKGRCLNPRHAAYSYYGGRGITICERWRDSYETFLDDVGRRPSPTHSIDRINNNLGYFPENVRWATKSEQINNRRNTRLMTCNGITQSVSEWSIALGISRNCILHRVRDGWSIERALTTPLRNLRH